MNKNENRTIARRLAAQMWGEINGQKKVAEGAWYFTCVSHGGYIVDLAIHPQFALWEEEVLYRKKYIRTSEQHFAALEEDCNWAIFDALYAGIAGVSLIEPSKDIKEKVTSYVREWNPDWYAAEQKVKPCEIFQLSRLIGMENPNYINLDAVAKGLLTLYYYCVGKNVEDLSSHIRFYLRANNFILPKNGPLLKKPEFALI